MKLKDLVNVSRSGVVLNRLKKSKEPLEGYAYRYITVKSLKGDGKIDFKELEETKVEESVNPRYLTEYNDIVMRSSEPFSASVIEQNAENLIVTSNLYVLKEISEKVLPEYLCIYLNSKQAMRQLVRHVSQSTISTISIKTIAELDVIIPTIETQQRIIDISNTAHKEIELLEELLNAKQVLSNSVIESLISDKEKK